MSYNVCTHIHKVDGLIKVKKTDTGLDIDQVSALKRFCPNDINGEKRQNDEDGHCANYVEFLSSAVLLLLKYFKVVDDLNNDKLAEYTILWLGYKLNQYPHENITTLNDFYTKHIKTNTYYNEKITNASDSNTYMGIIDKKQYLMNVDVNTISNFYEAFGILCKIYYELGDEGTKCEKCYKHAEDFVKKFEILNDDSNNTDGSPYRQILSTLSTDYNNLKNICSVFQSIPDI
ncbi:Plasmodium variant antigen protein Cir/Yir/Bir, putative, partial [Plasmodium chabaudi chabaudi]